MLKPRVETSAGQRGAALLAAAMNSFHFLQLVLYESGRDHGKLLSVVGWVSGSVII